MGSFWDDHNTSDRSVRYTIRWKRRLEREREARSSGFTAALTVVVAVATVVGLCGMILAALFGSDTG